MDLKNFDGSCAERQNPFAVFCLGWGKLDALSVRSYKLPFNFDGLVGPVKVGPLQSQELHLSHARRHGKVVECIQSFAFGRYQHLVNLAFIEDLHFFERWLWWFGDAGRITPNHAGFDSLR